MPRKTPKNTSFSMNSGHAPRPADPCEGPSRRAFLKVGFLGGLGLTLGDYFALSANKASAATLPVKAESAIFIFMSGGMTHIDTFDPKPYAPIEYRGELGTADTNTGEVFGGLVPKLAGIADKFSRGGQNLKSLPGRAWNAAKSMPGGMARGAWGAAKAAPGAVGGMLKSAPGALKNFRPGNLGNMARSFASGGAGKLPALGNLARGAGNFALGGAAIDAGVNAGDAYGAVFGGERGRKLVRQGNKDMADQAAGRGVLGTIWNAPNVTSNARAMMGLQQQIQEAQQAGQQQMVGGYQGMINAGANDAVSQAVQQAGLDPGALSNYRQVTRMYGQDPERMQRMIASNPELQQVQQLQQTAKRDYHRNLASSGFSNTDAQNLSQYMQGGANDSILGSMVGMTGENRMGMSLPDIYKAAEGDEKLRSSLNNLYRGVASGKVDPRAASTLLGNVSTDRKELLNQFHQAITGGEK